MTDRDRALEEKFKALPDAELARYLAEGTPNSVEVVLIQKEFARRDRLEQHQLDLKLIAEQVRWMKFSAVIGIVGTIVGVLLTALLTWWLQSNPSVNRSAASTPAVQQQSGQTTSGDRKEKAESVPSKPPESKSVNKIP